MDSDKLITSLLSSEEDDYSEDDDQPEEGRHAFCIEPKHEVEKTESASIPRSKRAKTVTRQSKSDNERSSGRRRKVYKEQRQRQIITITCMPIKKDQPKGPVIFINPNFVRRFIAKSINFASSREPSSSQTSVTIPSNVIKDIDFKNSSEESLKAACTMAVIRLVTECIEDSNKRDEKSNKILVSRLLEGLVGH